jgi:hypothetical protein
MAFLRGLAITALLASTLIPNFVLGKDCGGSAEPKPHVHRMKLQRERQFDGSQLSSIAEELGGGQMFFDPRAELEMLANKYGGASKIGFTPNEGSLPFDKQRDDQIVLGDEKGNGHSTPLQS